MGLGFIISDECSVNTTKTETKKIPSNIYQNIANTKPAPAIKRVVSSKSQAVLFSDEVEYASKNLTEGLIQYFLASGIK